MTMADLAHALLRRWYVPVAAVLVAVLATVWVETRPGVYYARVQVTFLAPSSALYPNSLATRSFDLVATAGVVAKLVNGNQASLKMADPGTTLVGEGVLDGVAVRLPDDGGQWSRYYKTQALDVEATGPSAEVVTERREATVVAIEKRLAELQVGVDAGNKITTEVLPVTAGVVYMGGSTVRAAGMLWLLAFAGALASVVSFESRSRRPPERVEPPAHA
jgi:hypothetical protein